MDFINQTNIKALKTVVFRASYLLPSKPISTVPSCADELVLNRFTILFLHFFKRYFLCKPQPEQNLSSASNFFPQLEQNADKEAGLGTDEVADISGETTVAEVGTAFIAYCSLCLSGDLHLGQ